ncbi:CoA pyrophosphatase [Roseobacter weihaiensis]|uniref:CoA pyrophosphatase n=1 Tax=Roseobacter weihaiensis TaxID=2763262 RepID=UPI001D0B84C3|nr:CoA pyrophosphatase [Roseobacter sp. H9]
MYDRARIRAALDRPGRPSSDFDLNPGTLLPEGRKLRPAGVLVGFFQQEDHMRVILTKRSSALKHHPGQIAFPGGKQDDTDESVTAAALREAHEEIGLPPSHVEVLGHLPAHETVTGFLVTPVIGYIHTAFEQVPEPGEVDEVFSVPLPHVLDASNFIVESRRWRGHRRSYFAVPYGPYYIWGATARMLRAWTDQMT